MTKLFDDKARSKLLSDINIDDYKKESNLNNIEIREITAKEARSYIALFHYSKTMPDSTKFSFGAFENNNLIGIICYGMGTSKNQYTSIIPEIQNGEYLELTRVWCKHNTKKNFESMFISKTLKILPENIKLVVSYADSSRRHCGIIYQATNWHYLGKSKGSKMLLTEDNREKHPRLIGIYRKRHPELKDKTSNEIMELYNWKYIQGGEKHRYVYIRGSKKQKKILFNKYIKDKVLPYPKCDKPKMESDIDIIKKEKTILAQNIG